MLSAARQSKFRQCAGAQHMDTPSCAYRSINAHPTGELCRYLSHGENYEFSGTLRARFVRGVARYQARGAIAAEVIPTPLHQNEDLILKLD